MKITSFKDVSADSLEGYDLVLRDVTFSDRKSRMDVYKACRGNQSLISDWFNQIGVVYDEIVLHGSNIFYRVNGELLFITDLSHSERCLLYLFTCRALGVTVAIYGLLERLDAKHANLIVSAFGDWDGLLVVWFNALPVGCLRSYVGVM